MLTHGRLILTSSGLLLDEVKSLLWKSLRRKDRDLATKAAKELHGRDKDQLTWKSLVTFLFEDHCLNSNEVLEKFKQLHCQKDKYGCIELLLTHCYTCRLACCLPIIAMDSEYDPTAWDTSLVVDDEYRGLLAEGSSKIDFELLLQHLRNAWIAKDPKELITYMKMVTMVFDHDKGTLSQKGKQYCLFSGKIKPSNVAAVVLNILRKLCSDIGDQTMASYLFNCCYLVTIQDAPSRLILFAVVAQYIHSDLVKQLDKDLPIGNIDWESVGKLDIMPSWAVDRHTYRGRSGKGTTDIWKKDDVKRFSEAELEEFHGVRPRKDINDFFTEGVLCLQEVTSHNPYWERCKEIYLEHNKNLQKTVLMTAAHYDLQLDKFPGLRGVEKVPATPTKTCIKRPFDKISVEQAAPYKKKSTFSTHNKSQSNITVDGGSTTTKCEEDEPSTSQPIELKMNTKLPPVHVQEIQITDEHTCIIDQATRSKKKSTFSTHNKCRLNTSVDDGSTTTNCEEDNPSTSQASELQMNTEVPPIQEIQITDEPVVNGPLLQIPTGSAKRYTRVDLKNKVVWKGPFNEQRVKLAMFLHRVLREVFKDPHTLEIERNGCYVRFALLHSADASMTITTKNFYDCIGKQQVEDGQFLLREHLGVIQLHNLPLHKFASLPATFWCHYLFRYLLNVGDSGLYNSITDMQLSFLYGVDLEDLRKNVRANDLLNLMFVKLPKKQICTELLSCFKRLKQEMIDIMKKEYDLSMISALADFYGIQFSVQHFEDCLQTVKQALDSVD